MPSPLKTCRACRRSYSGGETFCPEDGSRLFAQTGVADPSSDPLIGAALDGRYRVLRLLGEGGMGRVYEGEHMLIERRVAIKVLREDFTRREDVVERFRREAKSASRIGHPNIVDVLDFGHTPAGASYFVMELLAGVDLADVVARKGALSAERVTLIAYQCCHALAAAHEKGIVHRDMKPENVLLIEREGAPDFVKLVDFGVAKMSELDALKHDGGKLTKSGVIFGTPEYMSPEQAAGLAPDHRADIYALGITLYELLTGRVPFEGASFMSVLTKHASKPLPPMREVYPQLSISLPLETVVLRALAKDPAQRFQTAREMAQALADVPEMPPLPFRLSLAERRSSVPSTPEVTLQASSAPVETRARRSTRFGARVGLALAAGALALLGTFSVVVLSRGAAPSAAPGVPAAVAPAQPDARALTATAEPRAPAAGEPELALVPVRVTTDPAGASVRVVGGAEVCGSTPCAFEVVAGRPVALLAQRARAQAVTTVTPSGATELHLVLEHGGGAGAGGRAGAGAARPVARRAAAPDDLKVPPMFEASRSRAR